MILFQFIFCSAGTFLKFFLLSFENLISYVTPPLFMHWVSRFVAFVITPTGVAVAMLLIPPFDPLWYFFYRQKTQRIKAVKNFQHNPCYILIKVMKTSENGLLIWFSKLREKTLKAYT